MSTYLANCIRSFAANPADIKPETINEVALQVERMERALDEIVADSCIDLMLSRLLTHGPRP